jgi:hypothetical protein
MGTRIFKGILGKCKIATQQHEYNEYDNTQFSDFVQGLVWQRQMCSMSEQRSRETYRGVNNQKI